MSSIQNEYSVNTSVPILDYYNNYVFIKSDKPIRSNDLDSLWLFFRSSKNGGCDIVSQTYNKETNSLLINYKINECKQEILKRKSFEYKGYLFTAYDHQLEVNKFHKLDNILILLINSKESVCVTDLEFYADYLVPNNNIKIVESKILPNMYYIHLEQPLSINNVLKRHAKKPNFENFKTEIFEAYDTNVLLMELNSNTEFSSLEEFLDEHFNENTNSFWQLSFKQKNILCMITFLNIKDINGIIDSKHIVHNQKKLFEKCYNFDAVAYIQSKKELWRDVPENSAKVFKENSNAFSISNNNKTNFENSEIKDINENTIDDYKEAIENGSVSELDCDDPIYDLLNNCETVRTHFNKFLNSYDAVCQYVDLNGTQSLIIIKTRNNHQSREQWLDKLNNAIDEYWQENINCKSIKIEDHLIKENNTIEGILKKINEFTRKSFAYIKQTEMSNIIAVVGFKDIFFDTVSKIEKELKILTDKLNSINKSSSSVNTSSSLSSLSTYTSPSISSSMSQTLICSQNPQILNNTSKTTRLWSQLFKKSNVEQKQISKQEPFNEQQHIVQPQEKIPLVNSWLQSHNTSAHSLRQPSIQHILKSNETTIRENINDFNSATGNKESLTERLKYVVREKKSKDFCIHLNPLLITSLALKNCEDLLKDFKDSLAKVNAQIHIDGDLFIISSKPDSKIKNPRADKWRNDCFQVLDYYFNDKLNRRHIQLSKNMQSNKAIQKIREILVDEMKRRNVFVQIDTSKYFVRICGYRNTLNELYGSIRRKILVAESETLNRNHPLHSFKITDNDEPKIEVLYHFNDNYFDLFESNLLELKAICIRSTKSFQIEIISTNLDNGSNQKEINRWREEVTGFIQRFFSQFLMEKFDLPCSWEAKFPETKDVHTTIDNWYVKVLGPIDSVKTFIEVHKDT